MKAILKAIFIQVHKHLAPAPKAIVRCYIALISSISRLLPISWAKHIQSSVRGYDLPWSQKGFPPRTVRVGRATSIWLTPHLGEFDEWVLFCKHMTYEQEVFEWLEQNAPTSYDTIIEIGANAGINKPTLLGTMTEVIAAHNPDFLIEVPGDAPDEIEAIEALRMYRRVLILPDALQVHCRLFASPSSRDWLLIHPDSLARFPP